MQSGNKTTRLTTKKERPIIFNGIPIVGRMPLFRMDMRQAIRDDRKGQTRRVIEPQLETDSLYGVGGWTWNKGTVKFAGGIDGLQGSIATYCPYGKLGDVRCMTEPLVQGDDGLAHYKDDGTLVMSLIAGEPISWRWSKPWLSSIHMPTEAARTVRRYEDIRVERVQDISEEDAIAEGAERIHLDDLGQTWEMHRRGFQSLWNSINAKRGYGGDTNPWVWVIEFKRLNESSKEATCKRSIQSVIGQK